MKIHEYQARELFTSFGIPVPPGIVAEQADAAGEAFARLRSDHGTELAVVKAQVYAGGRGKAGGVKLVRSPEEASEAAQWMLSRPLITAQSGPVGVEVHKVLVAAGVDIEREFYVGIAIDRAGGTPVLIASREGGVEIEQVAHDNPDAIVRCPFSAVQGLSAPEAKAVVGKLGFPRELTEDAMAVMKKLSDVFLETDASLAEINPLVLTPSSPDHPAGQIAAIDAKISFDDNALFRQAQIVALADDKEEDPAEQRARKSGLSYIKLDGNIGCLVNGAGLAMATMDLIKLHGGEPANFLDVGGSASEEAVTEAFQIILDDPQVKGVLVNIFGGIMKCDVIARAIVSAAKQVGFRVPLVVRLEGTNVEKARRTLTEARDQIPSMQIGTDLTDAAAKISAA